MTEPREQRLSWVRDDGPLSSRLDSQWPEWDSAGEKGLAETLDRESDWSGWDGWSDDQKRSRLSQALDGWYPAEAGQGQSGASGGQGSPVDRIGWIRSDQALVARLGAVWPGWDDPGAGGLVATLDQTPEWSGWDAWSEADKRSYLVQTLDGWYPAEAGQGQSGASGGQGSPVDRIGWIRSDQALVARLGAVWPGWDDPGPGGLVATLDQTPEWSGWDTWSEADKRSYLSQTLDAWYPAQPAAEEPSPAAPPMEPLLEEPAAQELSEGIAAVLAEALEAIPEAAGLSPQEITDLLTQVISDELDALSG